VSVEPPAWTLLTDGDPPGRRNGCFVFDPTGPRLFVFGGTADAMDSTPGLFVFDARPGNEAWTLLTLAAEPELRSSGFGYFDPQSSRAVLGFGNSTTEAFQDFNSLGYSALNP
jgi:hypothetical protein